MAIRPRYRRWITGSRPYQPPAGGLGRVAADRKRSRSRSATNLSRAMSTHVEEDEAAETSTATSRIRPHHLAIGLGVGIALFTVISGVVPLITDWHNDNEVHRVVFIDVPGPLRLAFYTIIPVMLVWGAFQFAARMKNWERGRPAPTRRTAPKNAKRRFADYRAGVYMRTLLRDPAAV